MPTVCIRAVQICLMMAGARGLDLSRLFAARGVPLSVLQDPCARLPHPLIVDLWTEVPARCGDPFFGLHAAEATVHVSFDPLDHTLQHCETVRGAMECMARYVRLLHDAASIFIEAEGGVGRFIQRFDCEPQVPRHLVEMILARWVLKMRRRSPRPLPLREILLPHASPGGAEDEYARVFGAPIRFNAPHMALVFDQQLLDWPNDDSDPELRRLMEERVNELLRGLPARPDVLLQVQRRILAVLPSGPPELRYVARSLGHSARSLQRRLKEAETTYRELVDATRRHAALSHLRDPTLSLTEIAFLSGFSDSSAFHRAFRRWTGTTPREYRLARR